MDLNNVKSGVIIWDSIKQEELKGKTGVSAYKEYNAGNIRVRLAEYSANYKSAEWCAKGHVIHCINGEITLMFQSGKEIKLTSGNSIVIGEGDGHIAVTGDSPVKMFIVD